MMLYEPKSHPATIERHRKAKALRADGKTFAEVAKTLGLSVQTIRNICNKEYKRFFIRDEYRQRTSTPEEVHYETEFIRGHKLKFEQPQYVYPYWRRPRELAFYQKKPPEPPKPAWLIKIVDYPVGNLLGVAIVNAKDETEVMGEVQRLKICPKDSWFTQEMYRCEEVIPGDMVNRFVTKEELLRRGLLKC